MVDWDRVQSMYQDLGADRFSARVAQLLSEIEGALMRLCVQEGKMLEADLQILAERASDLGFAELARLARQSGAGAKRGPIATAELTVLQDCQDISRAELYGKIGIWRQSMAQPGHRA